ncbi:endonuclease domain-containing protein [Plantibacter sp. YIM 135347]|uniref:endonuclease domain-containing protein n=1 Tax=Plantibacter sp. YIM 135347 TaxID=3423919 RepID=UPI003D33353E
MNLVTWLNERRGIAHRADTLEAGFGRFRIETALADGSVTTIRRHWLHTRTCDAERLSAASVGGRLTCLTAAQQLGLWTMPDGLTHVAVPTSSSCRPPDDVRLHWGRNPAPSGRRELVEPIENTLAHLARCQPFERALVVFESAIRLGAVQHEQLRRLDVSSKRFDALVSAASGLSDSGIETIPRARLARLGIRMRQQVRIDGHRVDGLIGERLVIQIDGFGPHSGAAQRSRDVRQDRRLTLLGYTVLRFTYSQVLDEWPEVERTILAAMAQRLHLAA